jgi:hypothetical protein
MGHLFQFIYMRVELWANQAIGNYLGNHLGNFMGAHREHDWNKGGEKKKAKINFPKLDPLRESMLSLPFTKSIC